MTPTLTEINDTALQPYMKGKINNEQFFDKGLKPLRKFMLKQTRKKDIALFIDLAKLEKPKNEDAVPTHCLIPAFMISELEKSLRDGRVSFSSVYGYRYDYRQRAYGNGYDNASAGNDFFAV